MDMLQELISNFTLLTSFLFFGNLLFRKYGRYLRKHSWLYRVVSGLTLGLFGILLMMTGVWVHEDIMIDLRQLAIIISVYVGGPVSGLVTAIIISLYRISITSHLTNISLVAVANALITLAFTISFIRKDKLSLVKWMTAVLCALLLSISSLFVLLGTPQTEAIMLFAFVMTLGGLFTYFMIRYIRKTELAVRMLEEAANRDHLTGLHNPRAFDAIFEQSFHSSRAKKQPLGLLLLDIDHFKHVNDTFGHMNGDTVLIQFGALLNREATVGAYPSRKGGEEFAIVIGNCNSKGAVTYAEWIRQSVESYPFRLNDGTLISLTVSIGAGSFPDIAQEHLFEQVDAALYETKRSGRNQVGLAKGTS
jgi:diguanylate cyclase